MHRRLRLSQRAHRVAPDALRGCAALILVCLSIALLVGQAQVSGAPADSFRAAFGSEAPLLPSGQPVALTGPQAFLLVAGLGDSRQRSGPLLAPGVAASALSLGALLGAVVLWSSLQPRGLTPGPLGVRAPPRVPSRR